MNTLVETVSYLYSSSYHCCCWWCYKQLSNAKVWLIVRGIVQWRPSYLAPTPGLQTLRQTQFVPTGPTQSTAPPAAQIISWVFNPPSPLPSSPSSAWQAILQYPDGLKCPPRAVAVWRKWWVGASPCIMACIVFPGFAHLSCLSVTFICVYTHVYILILNYKRHSDWKKCLFSLRTSWYICFVRE